MTAAPYVLACFALWLAAFVAFDFFEMRVHFFHTQVIEALPVRKYCVCIFSPGEVIYCRVGYFAFMLAWPEK